MLYYLIIQVKVTVPAFTDSEVIASDKLLSWNHKPQCISLASYVHAIKCMLHVNSSNMWLQTIGRFLPTNTGWRPEYFETPDSISVSEKREVFLNYVVAAPIVRRSFTLTHIFVCGTYSSRQGLLVGNLTFGFDANYAVGKVKKEIENNTANFLAIVKTQHLFNAISIAFVTGYRRFTLLCVDESDYVQLQSRNEFSRSKDDNILHNATVSDEHSLLDTGEFWCAAII